MNRSVDSKDKFAAEAVLDKMKKNPKILRRPTRVSQTWEINP